MGDPLRRRAGSGNEAGGAHLNHSVACDRRRMRGILVLPTRSPLPGVVPMRSESSKIVAVHLQAKGGAPSCGYEGNAILSRRKEDVTCPWCLGARSQEEARAIVRRLNEGRP